MTAENKGVPIKRLGNRRAQPLYFMNACDGGDGNTGDRNKLELQSATNKIIDTLRGNKRKRLMIGGISSRQIPPCFAKRENSGANRQSDCDKGGSSQNTHQLTKMIKRV